MQALSEQARGIGFAMGPYVGRIGADRRELEKIQRDFAALKGHIAGAPLDQGANLLAEVWRGISSGIDARMPPDEPGAQTRFFIAFATLSGYDLATHKRMLDYLLPLMAGGKQDTYHMLAS